MKEIDLHGKKVKEAEEIFYHHLNEARLKQKTIEILFITGVGAIQAHLETLAKASDLHYYIQMSNRGCIVIEFE